MNLAIFEAALRFYEDAHERLLQRHEKDKRQGQDSFIIEGYIKNITILGEWMRDGRPIDHRLKYISITMQYGLPPEREEDDYSRGGSYHSRTLALDSEKWVLKGGYVVSDGEAASDVKEPIEITYYLNGPITGIEDLQRWLDGMDIPGRTYGPMVSASSF
jgi:hypothetical protein